MKKFSVSLFALTIFILQITTLIYAQSNNDNVIYLPILMYHQISEIPSKLGDYVITSKEFENDLKLLKKHGYTTITVQDLIDYVSGKGKLPDKPIMLTFDDGFESDYIYAYPLLKEYNMKAVFSVIGKYADLYSQDVNKHINYSHSSWDEIKEMHESGLAEFHSHTYNMHLIESRRGALKKKSESLEQYEKALAKDLGRLNDEYVEKIGVAPTGFACPFGCYNSDLKETLKKLGYSAILTSNQKINKLSGDPEELYRLNRYVRSHNKDVEKLINSWENTILLDKTLKSAD